MGGLKRPPRPSVQVWIVRDQDDGDAEIHSKEPRVEHRWGREAWYGDEMIGNICKVEAKRLGLWPETNRTLVKATITPSHISRTQEETIS